MTLDLAHRLAAATAVHDPSLMLELRVADAGTEPPPRRRPRGDLGAPLIAAAVVVAVVWANLPLGYNASGRRRSSAPSCAPGSTKA